MGFKRLKHWERQQRVANCAGTNNKYTHGYLLLLSCQGEHFNDYRDREDNNGCKDIPAM